MNMNRRTRKPRKQETATPFPPVQEETPQRDSAVPQHTMDEVPLIVQEVLSSRGQSLDADTKAFMESRFGHDFSQVRVHTDERAVESAHAVDALAYTVGRDIVFGTGQYAPKTALGERLLAHELSHTLQQNANIADTKDNLEIASSENRAESEAEQASQAIGLAQSPVQLSPGSVQTTLQRAKPGSSGQALTPGRTKADKVVLIKINLTAGRVTFVTSSGKEYGGDASTDLPAGMYEIIPDIAAKKWHIPKSEKAGLRFSVDLDDVDPWTLEYSKPLRLQVFQGEKTLEQVFGLEDVEKIAGDPRKHPNYLENVIQGVGIEGWAGPFLLYRKIVSRMGVDGILLSRGEVYLDKDPLKDKEAVILQVYKSRAEAELVLSKMGLNLPGQYTFYIGPGDYIYPTVISDTTAPNICALMRKALEIEHENIKAAQKLSFDLLVWYTGARYPAKARISEEAVGSGATTGSPKKQELFYKPKKTADPNLPPGDGTTTRYGDIVYSSQGTETEVKLAIFHETVHSTLTPKLIYLREFRATVMMKLYGKPNYLLTPGEAKMGSSFMRYLEEALAETYAQLRAKGIKHVITGIRYPIKEGYVELKDVLIEGAIGTIVAGGITYGVYVYTSPD